ncbi:thiamine ABC transporter substrate binding subunit [Aestuariivirga litoralis]|uniref:thiamine ABC transporter substrate binding subunit n=1 Tax=Aestuariivirga litoralis TaxID=2650924 RepID=UPI0018C4A474|nr:thiamine ABC transporter substrate binding subunit [Aestuariivirga litoralis]MBG1232040.1 thiamine ABC transporter substrate binding subunit [Aestuariivirga litoralis]
MRKLIFALFAIIVLSLPAAAKDVLNIYTYTSFTADWGPGAKIKAAFEKTCDCEVNYVALGDGVAMLNRLKLEGKSTKADLVLGFDTNLTAEAKATGLFGKHGADVSGATVPGGWSDDTFLPYDYGYFAVVYNSETLKNPPKSLDELVNGDPAQKIILEDPRASTPGLGFLLWMKQVYGDKASEAWAKLKPRILTTAASWDDAYALFTKGEAPMVFSYVTSPAYHMIEEKTDKYKAADFSEGHYLQIEVAGLIDASPHKALAQKFLAFMLSPDFQNEIPTTNWMMPAAKMSAPLPDAFNSLVKPAKTLLFTPDEVNVHRRDWINEWQKAVNG